MQSSLPELNNRCILSANAAATHSNAPNSALCSKIPLQIDVKPYFEPVEAVARRPLVCLKCAAVLNKYCEIRASGQAVCVFCGNLNPELAGCGVETRANDVGRIPGTVPKEREQEASGVRKVMEMYPEFSRDEVCFVVSANFVENVPHWSTSTPTAAPYQKLALFLVDEHLASREGEQLAALLQEAIESQPDNVGIGLLTFGSCVRLYRVFSPLFVVADTFSAQDSELQQKQLQKEFSKTLYIAPAAKALAAVVKAIESVSTLPALHEDRALLAAVEVASTLASCYKLPTELSVLTSGPPLMNAADKWRDHAAIGEPLRAAWEQLLPKMRLHRCLVNVFCVGCEVFHIDTLASFAAATGGTTVKGVSLSESHLRQSYLLQFCRDVAQPTTITLRTSRQLHVQAESTLFGQESSASEHEALDIKSTLTLAGMQPTKTGVAPEGSSCCVELAEWSPNSTVTFSLQPSNSAPPEQVHSSSCFVQIVVRTQPSVDRLQAFVFTFRLPMTDDPATLLGSIDVKKLLAVYARRVAKAGIHDSGLDIVENEVLKPWLRSSSPTTKAWELARGLYHLKYHPILRSTSPRDEDRALLQLYLERLDMREIEPLIVPAVYVLHLPTVLRQGVMDPSRLQISNLPRVAPDSMVFAPQSIVIMDTYTRIAIWWDSEFDAEEYEGWRNACRELMVKHAENRFPVPAMLLVKGSHPDRRWFYNALNPLHKDSPSIQLQSQPLLASLPEQERETIREAASFTDTPTFVSYVQSLGLTPTHLSFPMTASVYPEPQGGQQAMRTPSKPAPDALQAEQLSELL